MVNMSELKKKKCQGPKAWERAHEECLRFDCDLSVFLKILCIAT